MSKYTTEVRYICEQVAGFKESQPASKIDDVISSSWNKIFTTKCAFFNESYRKVLCSKILKHYYLREIGCETVGMWKYWMNTKLEEIMPYYNQLYKSAELEFSPFDDVNYTKTGNRSNEGSKQSDSTGTTKSKTDGTNTGTKTGNDKNNGTNNTDTTESDTIKKEGSSVTDTTGSGTVKNDATNSTTVTNNKSVETENNTDSTTTVTGKQSTTTNSTGYNLYSDTPQGSLSGVENQTYLTNVSKTTDIGTSETTNNTTTKIGETSTGTTTESGSSTTKNTLKNEQTTSNTGKDSTTDSSTETIAKTIGVKNTTSDTGEYSEKTSGTNVVNETGERTTKYGENTNGNEDYTETVKGKMSTTSYSKLLEEYRNTFLNIDMQVIEEFSELFLLLW